MGVLIVVGIGLAVPPAHAVTPEEAAVEPEDAPMPSAYAIGARGFLYAGRRGPALGAGLDFTGYTLKSIGFGVHGFKAFTPDECVCVQTQVQGTLFAEARAFPSFPLTPYARLGVGLAEIKWARWRDDELESVIDAYLGPYVEGGLDVHFFGASIRAFSFLASYPGVDLQSAWLAAGVQVGTLFDAPE